MHKVRYVSRKAHHPVRRKSGFLAPVKLSLTLRGFDEETRQILASTVRSRRLWPQNRRRVSASAKLFPGGNWRR
jgi:hypothetical protein